MLSNLIKGLVQIQNGYYGSCKSASVPVTFSNYVVLTMLTEHGYISGFSYSHDYNYSVALKYLDYTSIPALRKVQIISTPSRSVYMGARDLRRRFSTQEFALINTSLTRDVEYVSLSARGLTHRTVKKTGIITVKEAIEFNRGGQLLFSVF